MRKILFHLNSLSRGGTERVTVTLANYFAEAGMDVAVSTLWPDEHEYSLHHSVRRIHVGWTEADGKSGRLGKLRLNVRRIRALIHAEKPDVVIAMNREANYRTLAAAARGFKGTIVPVIISVRYVAQIQYGAVLDRLVQALLLPRMAGMVFQTQEQQAFFPRRIQKKSCVILNPLDKKFMDAPLPTTRKAEIVHASRLEARKNQAAIVRAFIRIHADYPDYTLTIYGGDSGDGTQQALADIIAAYDAAAYVRLAGASKKLEEEMKAAAMFVFNSDSEGLPNALMEAMALGLPVISSDCMGGGAKALIKDGINGLLIPMQDEAALEQAMRRLLADPEFAESLGCEARKINEICNVETIAGQWLDHIEGIL